MRALLALILALAMADPQAHAASSSPPAPRAYATAGVTLWVNGGSDSNSCLTMTNSCATVQGAVKKALTKYDAASQNVTIVLNQARNECVTVTGPLGIGTAIITIQGSYNGIVLSCNTAGGNAITASYGAIVAVTTIILQTTGSANACLAAGGGGQIILNQNVTFAGCVGAEMDAQGASINASQGWTISGGGQSVLHAHVGGIISIDNSTVTCTGSPAFSAYFVGVSDSVVEALNNVFTNCGTVTGPRFTVNNLGNIRTAIGAGSGDLNYFPGNSQGTTDAVSSYNEYQSVNKVSGVQTVNAGSPTISSGFGTGDVLLDLAGTSAWKDTVGTSPTSTATFNIPPFTTGISCPAIDLTTPGIVVQETGTTTTSVTFTSYARTTGLATAPTAGDVIWIGPCSGG